MPWPRGHLPASPFRRRCSPRSARLGDSPRDRRQIAHDQPTTQGRGSRWAIAREIGGKPPTPRHPSTPQTPRNLQLGDPPRDRRQIAHHHRVMQDAGSGWAILRGIGGKSPTIPPPADTADPQRPRIGRPSARSAANRPPSPGDARRRLGLGDRPRDRRQIAHDRPTTQGRGSRWAIARGIGGKSPTTDRGRKGAAPGGR